MAFNFQMQPGRRLNKRESKGECPLLSIVTGFYNAGAYFEQTYNCVMNQSFPWFEWIIVNDGSTKEEDVVLLQRLAQSDARIRVIDQPNGGLSAARNTAVRASKTDIFLPLDTDDLLEPNVLECLYWGLLCNPNAAFCYSDLVGFADRQYLWRQNFRVEEEKTNNLLVATAAIRKSAYEAVGGYRQEKGDFFEDWHFWLSLLGKGCFPLHLQQYGFWYRRVDSGMLGGIYRDEKLKTRAERLIAEAALNVGASPPAIQFPLPISMPTNEITPILLEHLPNYRALLPPTGQGPILLLVSTLADTPENRQSLELARMLAVNGHRLGVMALFPGDTALYQEYLDITADTFYLPGFLRYEEQSVFLHWHIKTRGVRLCLCDDVPGALCWQTSLQEEHPTLCWAGLARDNITRNLMQGLAPKMPLFVPQDGREQELIQALIEAVSPQSQGIEATLGVDTYAEQLLQTEYTLALRLFGTEYNGTFAMEAIHHTCLQPRRKVEKALSGKKILVSVVCRVTNEALIWQTLRALQNQTTEDYEVLLLYSAVFADAHPVAVRFLKAYTAVWPHILFQQEAEEQQALVSLRGEYSLFLPEGCLPRETLLETLYWGLAINDCAAWGVVPGKLLWHAGDTTAGESCPALRVGAVICSTALLSVLNKPAEQALWKLPLKEGHSPLQFPENLLWLVGPGPARPDNVNNIEIETRNGTFLRYPKSSRPGTYTAPQKVTWNTNTRPRQDGKLHVAMLAPWMAMGGAEKFNANLLQHLDKTCYKVSLLTTEENVHTWEHHFSEITPEVFSLAEFLPTEAIPAFLSYFIQSRNVDILLITNSALGYEIVPWLRIQFPRLAICDYVHMEDWNWKNGGFSRYSGMMGDVLERTFVCNDASRRVIVSHFGRDAERTQTVYIGTDAEFYSPQSVPKGQVRRELGISAERPLVLYACRLEQQKRPRLMMEIALSMYRKGSSAAFVVVGEGPDEASMRTFSAENGLENTVFFVGRQSDLRPYYQDADVLLICSRIEGLTLTTYEAMAMETPVITSDVGGQAELVDSNVGVVLPPSDQPAEIFAQTVYSEEDIALYVNALTHLLSDNITLSQKGQRARRRILAEFTIDCMVQSIDAAFTRLMEAQALSARRDTAAKLEAVGKIAEELATLGIELSKGERGIWMDGETAQQYKNALWENEQIKSSAIYRMFKNTADLLDRLRRQKK